MRLVHGYPEVFVPYLLQRIPHVRGFGGCATMGVISDAGEILGAVCFHGYQPEFKSIEVSTAAGSKRWLTKHIIQQIFGYPFVQLGCERVAAITPRRAKDARAFLKTFGFKLEGVGRKGFGPYGDAIAYSLLRDEFFASRWAAVKPAEAA